MEDIMGEEEPYPMIDELMKIEKKYLSYERREGFTGQLQKSLGWTLHKKGTKYDIPFTLIDKDKAVTLIALIIKEYDLTPQEIYDIIKEYSHLDHWRITEILYHFEKVRELHMETTMRSFVPGIKASIYRPPDEYDSNDKGGVMYQKIASNYPSDGIKKTKRKTKRKKKRKKRRYR
tara:strand:+ start:3328 stop:3855 length:528 start_codon:yes stop_codon:yes gene_type:complete